MPPDLALLSTLHGWNYPCLELNFMVTKVFEPLQFDCICTRVSRLFCDVNVNVENWPRGYKTFFMLNSVEHKILNAHKYKNINKFSIFPAQISPECYFSRL